MSKLTYPIPDLPSVVTLCRAAEFAMDARNWYDTARAQVYAASGVLNQSPARVAEVLALFSPRVRVDRNIKLAIAYLKTDAIPSGTVRNVAAQVRHWEATGIIRGRKCAAFSRAIMGDPWAVVLDTWMGVVLGVDPKRFEVRAVWDACESRVYETSDRLGWTPASTQAALWASAFRATATPMPEYLISPEL